MSQRLECLNGTVKSRQRKAVCRWSSQEWSISFGESAAALLLRANPSGGGVGLAAGLQGQVLADGLGMTSSAGVQVSLACWPRETKRPCATGAQGAAGN